MKEDLLALLDAMLADVDAAIAQAERPCKPYNGPTREPCKPHDNVKGTGQHKHRCRCGETWKHGDELQEASYEQFEEGHTCPSCGKFVTMKYGEW